MCQPEIVKSMDWRTLWEFVVGSHVKQGKESHAMGWDVHMQVTHQFYTLQPADLVSRKFAAFLGTVGNRQIRLLQGNLKRVKLLTCRL